MFGTLEDTSVWGVVSGDELHEGGGTTGMSLLYSSNGHGIGDSIERHVHVLLEEASELVTNKESFGGEVSVDTLPDNLLLAVSAQGLVLRSIKRLELFHFFDWAVLVVNVISIVVRVESLVELFDLSGNNCTCEEGSSERELHVNNMYRYINYY